MWIKLYSKFQNWEWYKDEVVPRLFVHFLINANWKDGKYKGYDVPRGSLVTGRKKLAQDLELTEQQVRTGINKLKSTNDITTKPTNKFSIISITNYELYQQQSTNNQPANQPTINQQLFDKLTNKIKLYHKTNQWKANISIKELTNKFINAKLKNNQQNNHITDLYRLSDLNNNKRTHGEVFEYDWLNE